MVENEQNPIVRKGPGSNAFQIDGIRLLEEFGDRKILAIRYVQAQTGLGLKEVKDLVDAVYDRRPIGGTFEPAQPKAVDQRELVRRFGNRKIEAIKYVREQTGLGLKEAKDFVDAAYEGVPRDRSGGRSYPRDEGPNNGPEIIDKPRRWPVIVAGLAIIVIGVAAFAYYMLSFAA